MNNDHQRQNNFDCIRLLAALSVMYSHQVKLSDRGIVAVSDYHDLGKMGVLVFFAISGYLVMQSWERDPNLWRFLARRLLRIWPGLLCVVLLMAFVLGPAMTTLPAATYFHTQQTWDFLSHLWFHVDEQRLPGVFTGNVITRVDGPLWTIPIEAGWYVVLGTLGVIGVLRHRLALLAVTLACTIYVFRIYRAESDDVERFWEMEFGLFFLYGACMHACHEAWRRRPLHGGVLMAGLSVLSYALGHDYLAIWLILPYFTVVVAQASTPLLRDAGRWGDFSYGIYIYSFPVQQSLVWLTGNSLGLASGMLASLAITLMLAWASWTLVEKPALRMKRLLRPSAGAARTAADASPA